MTACLSGHVRISLRDVEIAVRVPLVAERSRRQPRHAAGVSGGERNPEAVRSGVGKAVHGVRPEVVILPLFAVGDDRRACRFEPLDRVADRVLVESIEARIVAVPLRHGLDQRGRPGQASDGFCWNHRGPCREPCSARLSVLSAGRRVAVKTIVCGNARLEQADARRVLSHSLQMPCTRLRRFAATARQALAPSHPRAASRLRRGKPSHLRTLAPSHLRTLAPTFAAAPLRWASPRTLR